MFKNLNVHPPGGWRFYQPEIDWPKDPRELRGIGLEAVVDLVLQKRSANHARFPQLSLDRDTVRAQVIQHTEEVVRKMPGTADYFVDGAPAVVPRAESFPQARSLREKAAHTAGTIKKAMAGVGLLADWLGEGMEPISQDQATARATVCATSGVGGKLCPFNRPATGLQKVTSGTAAEIKLLMEAKQDLKLGTSYDSVLFTCQICECHLPLKIWAPAAVLEAKTPADVKEKFRSQWPACWVNKEGGQISNATLPTRPPGAT